MTLIYSFSLLLGMNKCIVSLRDGLPNDSFLRDYTY